MCIQKESGKIEKREYHNRSRRERDSGGEISSLATDIDETERAVRGHWMIESYHWHLDVTFREDGNHTLEKQAAYNLNIIRKLALNILKIAEVGHCRLSMRKKRYAIGTNPEKYLEELMDL
ncbi:hypothetical protein H8S37_09295 [Mediterraneibacter sp. NSJ-55]|uniref:Transposase IS4-like domain-containing protein n=1 Tax=Mediterraneibacter hominis TaxID=2763054 RepID=A0A923LIX7_9FIRM|nr:hypothetical protein [Mediterraneibacter hominis]MBC5689120.1 hypothetical protein [Mediterraneibacter hominis]